MSLFHTLQATMLFSLEKNTYLTRLLLKDVYYRAIHENDVCDCHNPALTSDEKIIHLMRCYKDLLGFDQLQIMVLVAHHVKTCSLTASEIVEKVVDRYFEQDENNFIFIIGLFTLMDVVFWSKYQLLSESDVEDFYPTPLENIIETTVGEWVFFNGGWQHLMENFSGKIPEDGRELLNELCEFVLDM